VGVAAALHSRVCEARQEVNGTEDDQERDHQLLLLVGTVADIVDDDVGPVGASM
jgi:hypothetical protein